MTHSENGPYRVRSRRSPMTDRALTDGLIWTCLIVRVRTAAMPSNAADSPSSEAFIRAIERRGSLERRCGRARTARAVTRDRFARKRDSGCPLWVQAGAAAAEQPAVIVLHGTAVEEAWRRCASSPREFDCGGAIAGVSRRAHRERPAGRRPIKLPPHPRLPHRGSVVPVRHRVGSDAVIDYLERVPKSIRAASA